MSRIAISDVTVDGSHVSYEIRPTGRVRRFFTGADFHVDYGTDVSAVPRRILTIPVLAQICPVAWANDAPVYAPVVDEQFLSTLETVRDRLVEMYPSFVRGGAIEVDRVESANASHRPETGVLFTGGVDSTATYLNNREADPQLITVQGWVIKHDDTEQWRNLQRHVEDFADAEGARANFIESNLRSFLNPGMLDAHFRRYLEGTWYAAVGHGLGLLGLCAPLTVTNDIGRLGIAATHHDGIDFGPWGSHPDIDDNVSWSGTDCFHDGYDTSRQDKIEAITAFEADSPRDLSLQTCNERVENCSRCSKCLRTIAGLVVAGADPARFGYRLDEELVAWARDRFADPAFCRDERAYRWIELGDRADPDRDGVDHDRDGDDPDRDGVDRDRNGDDPAAVALLRLLAETDFEDRIVPNEPTLRDRVAFAAMRNVPYELYSVSSSLLSELGLVRSSRSTASHSN